MKSIPRREFLRLSGVVGSGLMFAPLMRAEVERRTSERRIRDNPPYLSDLIAVPDSGWRMWRDTKAAWQEDKIFLPGDVKIAELPVRPPSGGWAALEGAGREVTLPATVEQFHWGEDGLRPYKDEYRFETSDNQVKNGAYFGVSWWWRSIEIPAAWVGRRIILHVRGARQRAEVFLNEKLVGYSIMEELPFECDLTTAAHAGENRLALRITNPGGRFDWRDNDKINWAGLEFQKSHGFGGLDRGLALSVHGPVRITDTWVLNTPEPRTIDVHAEIENHSATARSGLIRFSVIDPSNGDELAKAEAPLALPANASGQSTAKLTAPTAELWDLTTPRLYRLVTTWVPAANGGESDAKAVEFGFRWFVAEGIGQDAIFRLNGRRIRLYTSISWGYWALNGLFPTPELAAREVSAAKAFNLNCLNFHRNLPKEEVLALQDRAGLLRCLEPGGGSQAIARRGPVGFPERYAREKMRGMIRACRSHPSVVHYIIQNEGSLDTANPSLLELFALMRAEDPSRSIVGTDGFVMRSPQAWQEAYSAEVHRSDKPAKPDGGAAGWWVDHSGHATDIWQDRCYTSPRDFYYSSPVRKEIVEWGEMKGPASSDDHAAVLALIRKNGGTSYDRLDHEEMLAAYDAFLDRWGFRAAFASSSALFRSIGQRAYDSWGQFMENVRISDETDMAVISGWESTAMENHSGIVDNFREFKADPKAIAESLTPLRPVAKQRQLVVGVGEHATFDLYLLNDTHASASGELVFTLFSPEGRITQTERYAAPAFERDRLSYLVHEALTTPPLDKPGRWRTRFELTSAPTVTHEREILVIDVPVAAKPLKITTVDLPGTVAELLQSLPAITVVPFESGKAYDVIIFGGRASAAPAKGNATTDDGANVVRATTEETGLPDAVLAAVRTGTPLLVLPTNEGHAIAVAKQLAAAGAFRFDGMVGVSRASWMGAWTFVREHPLYAGLPVNQALGLHYQVRSGGVDGWRVEGEKVEVVAGYGRDHDRNLGAATLVTKVGQTPVVLHQILGMHPVMLKRFLANAVGYLTS